VIEVGAGHGINFPLYPESVTRLLAVEPAEHLRPSSELRVYEHVIAHNPLGARLERVAEATVWPAMAGGCHMSRNTQAALQRGGFSVESVERFPFCPSPIVPRTPHLIGIARLAD
jgi:hypothetical protein